MKIKRERLALRDSRLDFTMRTLALASRTNKYIHVWTRPDRLRFNPESSRDLFLVLFAPDYLPRSRGRIGIRLDRLGPISVFDRALVLFGAFLPPTQKTQSILNTKQSYSVDFICVSALVYRYYATWREARQDFSRM